MNPELNPDGVSVKGCSIIYAPAGQAGEYSALATNPYRGCGHGCAYCLAGDTLVQMADGTTLPIRDIRVGDRVIGVTETDSRHWPYKYTFAEVTATLRSVKRAVRITFENGRTVTCSGDHRWLSDRGWKYAEGAMSGPDQRPYLTINNRVRALGPAIPAMPFTEDYKRGYLSGIIKGDGTLGRYDYSGTCQRAAKNAPQKTDIQHQFRLAMKDVEALHRASDYLAEFGVQTTAFSFAHSEGKTMPAIRANSEAAYNVITQLIAPNGENGEWLRGWLAGIFDAEGGSDPNCRISNKDEDILAMIERAESYFGFDHERDVSNEIGCLAIRFRGGLAEATRFFQLVRPAITRKWDIAGRSPCDSFQVESIESLGVEMEMFDITTTAETFIANGMVSHNCYVPNVLRMTRSEIRRGRNPSSELHAPASQGCGEVYATRGGRTSYAVLHN